MVCLTVVEFYFPFVFAYFYFLSTGGMLSGINGCSDIFKVAVTVLLVCLIHVENTSFF